MKTRVFAAILAALFLTNTPTVSQADTVAERDARRTGFIVGFVCHQYIAGQLGKLKFLENGEGIWSMPQHSDSFTWSVRNDKYCFQAAGGKKQCSDFPKRTLPNEKEAFDAWLRKGCLFNDD